MAGTVFTTAAKAALFISLVAITGCKSEAETRAEAAEALWVALEQENDNRIQAEKSGNRNDMLEALQRMSALMYEFSDEHLDTVECSDSFPMICSIPQGGAETDQILEVFSNGYFAITMDVAEFFGVKMDELEANSAQIAERLAEEAQSPAIDERAPPPPASEIDGNALLPPPSSD